MPGLREFYGGEFDNGRSVYGVAFQLFERCVCRHAPCAVSCRGLLVISPANAGVDHPEDGYSPGV